MQAREKWTLQKSTSCKSTKMPKEEFRVPALQENETKNMIMSDAAVRAFSSRLTITRFAINRNLCCDRTELSSSAFVNTAMICLGNLRDSKKYKSKSHDLYGYPLNSKRMSTVQLLHLQRNDLLERALSIEYKESMINDKNLSATCGWRSVSRGSLF